MTEYVSTVENSKVVLTQFVANLFITVSFGFWWVFSFLMEKSNRRGFNRASIKRSLNFLRVPLEIFHFNLLIQSVFQRGDDKNNFFSKCWNSSYKDHSNLHFNFKWCFGRLFHSWIVDKKLQINQSTFEYCRQPILPLSVVPMLL